MKEDLQKEIKKLKKRLKILLDKEKSYKLSETDFIEISDIEDFLIYIDDKISMKQKMGEDA